jgi:hypothetical protein
VTSTITYKKCLRKYDLNSDTINSIFYKKKPEIKSLSRTGLKTLMIKKLVFNALFNFCTAVQPKLLSHPVEIVYCFTLLNTNNLNSPSFLWVKDIALIHPCTSYQ